MVDVVPEAVDEPVVVSGTGCEKKEWPRAFQLVDCNTTPKPWWNHTLYRGPNEELVVVDYCTTKDESEKAATHFLEESLIGFDMEWVIDYRTGKKRDLQDEISMIQIASETRIALFHIGQHKGKTTDELIAPTLQKIIESSEIVKTGHNIMSADCGRLKQFFGIHPKAIFELCHLDYLVTHGPTEPERVNTVIRNTSLGTMVNKHLGYEMCKDADIRKCNWRRALNKGFASDKKKIMYAAADAYAGTMLYHCMNAQRLAMDPTPPLPLLADDYLPFQGAQKQAIRLKSETEGQAYTTAPQFYIVAKSKLEPEPEPDREPESESPSEQDGTLEIEMIDLTVEAVKEAVISKLSDTQVKSMENMKGSTVDTEPLSTTDTLLYEQLLICRDALALQHQCESRNITSVAALRRMARQRPVSKASLKKVRGVGELTRDKYGTQFLNVITKFQAGTASDEAQSASKARLKAKGKEKTPREPLDATAKALFEQLKHRRYMLASNQSVPPYVVAHDSVLENLARQRPLNRSSLLKIKGMGPVKADNYGTYWLEVINAFVGTENELPTTKMIAQCPNIEEGNVDQMEVTQSLLAPDGHRGRNRLRNQNHSSRDSSPAFDSPPRRNPVLHTGLSFNMGQTSLESQDPTQSQENGVNEATSSDSEPLPFMTPPSRPPSASGLNRKRPGSPLQREVPAPDARGPNIGQMTSAIVHQAVQPLPQEQQLFRNKLLAFSKLVSCKLSTPPKSPIAPDAVLDSIVALVPRTEQALRLIPGIDSFISACDETQKDLLKFINKCAPMEK